jgi:hypothetical protein
MVKRYLVVFALSALVLPGQETKEAAFDEVAFRKAVQDGRLEDPGDRAMFFALQHEEVAIPILVAGIKAKLNDPDANQLSWRLLIWL